MELAFWLVVACIASYFAGVKRRSAVDRDEAFLRLESRAMTAEYCLAQSTSEAANWRAAFMQAEAVIDETKASLTKLALSHREQVLVNGEVMRRLYGAGFSKN